MKIEMMAVFLLIISTQAFANGLSGTYTVLARGVCDLQADTSETIAATPTRLTMTLNNPSDGNTGDLMFSATLGDIISRPNAFDISHDYTETDRQISSYNSTLTSFSFAEYEYDMSLTDAQGLAQTPFQTIELKSDGRGGVLYKKTYSDGEVYTCTLAPSL